LFFPLLMLSPRYKDWVKLSNQEEGGEVVVKRPRFFILAASEWLLYLLSLLGDLLIYLSIGFLLLEM
ncbi:MAG: hypothetical protein VZR55_04835, partial [Candidatus Enteromonas sp.]|nr:hypothetical protein [Candidatus Enteromonas sp.]